MHSATKTFALVATLSIAAAHSAAFAQSKAEKYRAPVTSDGVPDLGGNWTNAMLTPFERPAKYGTRSRMTPEEVAAVEQGEAARKQESLDSVDPKLGAADTPRAKMCAGLAVSDCGYSSVWKDPGTQVLRVAGEARTSIITSTVDGRLPPVKASAMQKDPFAPPVGAVDVDNPETADGVGARCLLFAFAGGPVMRPSGYNSNYEIVQSKDTVAIWVEAGRELRVIPIGGKHQASNIRPWLGDSIGHYEGNTLVVETINFNPAHSISYLGSQSNKEMPEQVKAELLYPTDKLKVTERLTRVGADRLHYQFTVEDPGLWDQPWSGEYEFRTGKPLYEYACHEGNYALVHILAGAREEERVAGRATGRASR